MEKERLTQYACNLIVVNIDAYEAMCKENNASRANDVPDDVVYSEWVKHCALTVERAQHIIHEVAMYNAKNTKRQIRASYRIYSGVVTLTIDDKKYCCSDYVSAVVALRYLGLRVSYI